MAAWVLRVVTQVAEMWLCHMGLTASPWRCCVFWCVWLLWVFSYAIAVPYRWLCFGPSLSCDPPQWHAVLQLLRWIKDWDRARACNNWWAWPTSVVKPAKRTSNIDSKAEYVDYMWNRAYQTPKGSKKASNYAVSAVCSISHLPGHVTLPHPSLYKV